jgi:hypothetical protein
VDSKQPPGLPFAASLAAEQRPILWAGRAVDEGCHVYVPRMKPGMRVPPLLNPVTLGLGAILVTLAVWAAFMAHTTSDEENLAVAPVIAPGEIRSIAYVVSENGEDRIYVRPASAEPFVRGRFIHAFSYLFNRMRGSAAPTADMLAALHMDTVGGGARLSLVSLPDGQVRDVEGQFDYLSALAWSPESARIAATRTLAAAAPGQQSVALVEIDTRDLRTTEVAEFEDIIDLAPVGYSIDGKRLFFVVVDQSGSSLWSHGNGRVVRLATFAAGPTRNWSLSPDGSRLAFIDRLGLGERTYVGKVLVIATGAVSDTKGEGDQLGAAWPPGSLLPAFGGPGGTLQLTDPNPGAYVIPLGWAPDGSSQVVTVVSPGPSGQLVESVEVVSPTSRVKLAAGESVLFLGYVRNIE